MSDNSKIPPNYQTVMPYLIINEASNFIGFMKEVFGAVETHKTMRDPNTIMHGEIMIGGSTIMFADTTDKIDPSNAGLFIYVDDADVCYTKAIANGARSINELSDQPYGRTGGILDPFGNTWWITSLK